MNRELVKYVETNILPRYEAFSDGHGRDHVEMVIRESLYLAENHMADSDMCYAIAAYHDIGIPQGRELHHMASAAILASDARLAEWFNAEQINVMREAVEDHRASADRPPRTIYGCIIADADHFVDPENVLRRTILYGRANYPDMTQEEQIARAREHVRNKYCEDGYLHFCLNDPRSLDGLRQLRALAADRERFDEICRRYM